MSIILDMFNNHQAIKKMRMLREGYAKEAIQEVLNKDRFEFYKIMKGEK